MLSKHAVCRRHDVIVSAHTLPETLYAGCSQCLVLLKMLFYYMYWFKNFYSPFQLKFPKWLTTESIHIKQKKNSGLNPKSVFHESLQRWFFLPIADSKVWILSFISRGCSRKVSSVNRTLFSNLWPQSNKTPKNCTKTVINAEKQLSVIHSSEEVNLKWSK